MGYNIRLSSLVIQASMRLFILLAYDRIIKTVFFEVIKTEYVIELLEMAKWVKRFFSL